MRQKDIAIYTDPDSFDELGGGAKFPCTTNLMEYKAMVSRYFITVEGFQHYGVNTDLYQSDSPNRLEEFADEVSEDLYGVMARLAPYNYEYNCYLVAQSLSRQYPNRYAARKQFERALIYQARYKLKNADIREVNGIDLEANNNIYHKQLPKSLGISHPKPLIFSKP